MCKIVCKVQRLKNGLQFNVSKGSVSSINPKPTDVLRPCKRGMGVKLSPSCYFLDRELLFIDFKLSIYTKELKNF